MKVLIAEDDPVSRRLLQASLERWGYEVVVAKDGTEATQILLSPDAPKMALLDWLMPGVDGVQLCRNIRRNKPEPYTYILMLTGRRTQDDVIRGLEAGADDYVRKPFDPSELKVRLRTGKRILYLQDRLITSREALRDQATRDPLTGLWNRAAILDILGDELARSAREGGSLASWLPISTASSTSTTPTATRSETRSCRASPAPCEIQFVVTTPSAVMVARNS